MCVPPGSSSMQLPAVVAWQHDSDQCNCCGIHQKIIEKNRSLCDPQEIQPVGTCQICWQSLRINIDHPYGVEKVRRLLKNYSNKDPQDPNWAWCVPFYIQVETKDRKNKKTKKQRREKSMHYDQVWKIFCLLKKNGMAFNYIIWLKFNSD